MKVIAFSGFKRSGKDTAADYICDKYGFERVAFADPLKDEVAHKFGIPRSHLDDPKFKEAPLLHIPVNPQDDFSRMVAKYMVKEYRTKDGKVSHNFEITTNEGLICDMEANVSYEKLYHTPRSLTILIGSTNRSVDTSYWVKKAIKVIEEAKLRGIEGVVVSDLRYQSEMKQLEDAFGLNLTTIRIDRFDNINSTDSSELDLVNHLHNFTVTNKGTKEEFLFKIDELLNTYS